MLVISREQLADDREEILLPHRFEEDARTERRKLSPHFLVEKVVSCEDGDRQVTVMRPRTQPPETLESRTVRQMQVEDQNGWTRGFEVRQARLAAALRVRLVSCSLEHLSEVLIDRNIVVDYDDGERRGSSGSRAFCT
jgi:hypothetical protein